MKSFYLVLTLVVIVAADFYDSKYDHFDVQPLVENDRILLSFAKCFIDQGPCSPDATTFKKIIPEALETTCGKCSPKQKQLIRQVIKALIEKHPEMWKQITEKYDAKKQYKESFEKFLNGE